jgi:NAD-dependent dihydropyrimidine dehydrogenase PreA subunit
MFNSYTKNSLRYDRDLCINCGMCLDVCPHAVFEADGRAVRLAHPAACMECGACALNCPSLAIVVDSGVGCATAMIMAALRGKHIDDKEACSCGDAAGVCCS